MKHFTVRTCALALLGLCWLSPAWSQGRGRGEPPAEPAAPQVSKEELDAYNKFVADSIASADARQKITLAESFIGLYPNSMFAGAVYAQLAPAYLEVNDVDKMIDTGEKALAADPNNVDVLPLMAWATRKGHELRSPRHQSTFHHAKACGDERRRVHQDQE